MIGSTDTHLGAPGATAEADFPGHGGAGKPAESTDTPAFADELEFNPGGLAGVWAEENTRAAIFAALQRREVFATSGPRMSVRVFGGPAEALPADLCSQPDRTARAMAQAAPMGTHLTAAPTALTLYAEAKADPASSLLQRIQVVRVTEENGALRETVVDVAGSEVGAVDPATCARDHTGADALCTVWTDPSPPTTAAAYYVRVLEVPSCRWSQQVCVAAKVDCTGPVPASLRACCSADTPAIIQERAWSSPIWWSPAP
jgi:hypothetical protein